MILILKAGSLILLEHIFKVAFWPCLTPLIFSLITNISLFGNTLILSGKPSIMRPLLEQNMKCSTGSTGINFTLKVWFFSITFSTTKPYWFKPFSNFVFISDLISVSVAPIDDEEAIRLNEVSNRISSLSKPDFIYTSTFRLVAFGHFTIILKYNKLI